MPVSTYRFILPYLPELRRLVSEVQTKIDVCEKQVSEYQTLMKETDTVNMIEVVCSIEELLDSATGLLLTTRAGCLSAGVGQRSWVS